MIWFENIKQWFVDNATYILSFLTPANIIAAIAAIFVAIRNNKATKNTNAIGTAMSNDASKIANVSETIDKNTASIENMKDLHRDLEAKVKAVSAGIEVMNERATNKLDELEDKMNAILQVQSMVYGTIQDSELRQNVQNLIATAKMSSDHTREKLQAEIESLKAEVSTKVNAISEAVADGVKQIEEASKSTVSKKKSLRY